MQTVVYRGIDLALYMLVFDIVEGVKSDLKVKEVALALGVDGENTRLAEVAFLIFCAVHCVVAKFHGIDRRFHLKGQHLAALVYTELNVGSVRYRAP